MAAMATVVPFIAEPLGVEVVAVWRAVSVCADLGFQRVIFERDSSECSECFVPRKPVLEPLNLGN
jgi:hypothetical protein